MNYVRNAWYVAAWADEIVPERPAAVRILNEPIVLWRTAEGELTAFEDRCIHRLAPLSLGRCEGQRLRCMYHGLLYDRSGRVVEVPGQDKIPSSLRVRVYPAVERHSWIWIWMGEAAADESLIPPLIGFSDPDEMLSRGYQDLNCSHGQLDYAAEARLVNENLLDLGHSSFLHAETFRYSETWARERPQVTEQGRCIRTERWIRNEGALSVRDAKPLVDTYFRCDFYVPGALLMEHRTYPVGTADAMNGQTPDLSQAHGGFASDHSFSTQAVTPVTDRTARYFYIHAHKRSQDAAEDRARIEAAKVVIDKAFSEDRSMIEAQQRRIDDTPGWRFMPTGADRGIALYNRLVERLVREESKETGDENHGK